jgi:cytochrome c biogenesis protein CcdA
MAKVGAAALIAVGVTNILTERFPRFPNPFRIPHSAHHKMAELMERASAPSAFLLGGLVGLCEFPCTGGPYLMVLGLLHDESTWARGVMYLLFYNAVFVLPLLLMLAIASNEALVERLRQWQRRLRAPMRVYGGVAMVALGMLMFLI